MEVVIVEWELAVFGVKIGCPTVTSEEFVA